jgi:hypothetical protein
MGLKMSARIWACLGVPACAWILYEYGAAASLRTACSTIGGYAGVLWGALSLVVCLAAVLVLSSSGRAAKMDNPPVRPWLARVGMLASGIFALAIAFQTLATLIVPGCSR